MGATMSAAGFTKKYLEVLKTHRAFEDTVTEAIADGKLEVHEIDAMLSILRGSQVETGKVISQLGRARQNLLARNATREAAEKTEAEAAARSFPGPDDIVIIRIETTVDVPPGIRSLIDDLNKHLGRGRD